MFENSRRHTFLGASEVGAAEQSDQMRPLGVLLAVAVGLVAPATGKSLSDASLPDASALTEPVPLGGDAVKLSEKWRWPWEPEQPVQQLGQQQQQGVSKSKEGGEHEDSDRKARASPQDQAEPPKLSAEEAWGEQPCPGQPTIKQRSKHCLTAPEGASNCGLEGLVDALTQHGKSSCADIEPSQRHCEDYYTRHPTKSNRYTLCRPMDATNKTCGPGLAFGCTWTRGELQTRSYDPSVPPEELGRGDPEAEAHDLGPWMVPPGADEPGDYPYGQPAAYPMGVCAPGCVPEGTNPRGAWPAGSNPFGSNPAGTYNPNPSKLKTASGGLTPGGFPPYWPGGGTAIRAPTNDGKWEFCWCLPECTAEYGTDHGRNESPNDDGSAGNLCILRFTEADKPADWPPGEAWGTDPDANGEYPVGIMETLPPGGCCVPTTRSARIARSMKKSPPYGTEMERDGYYDATGYHKWADLKCNRDPAVSINDPSNAGAKLQSEWFIRHRLATKAEDSMKGSGETYTTPDGTYCSGADTDLDRENYWKCSSINERLCS